MNIKSASDVIGWTPPSQHKAFETVAAMLPDDANILEIGPAWGRSTWKWMELLTENGTMTALDAFILSRRKLEKMLGVHSDRPDIIAYINECLDKGMSQEEVFYDQINRHPDREKLKHVYNKTYYEWKKINDQKFDMVYLDFVPIYDQWVDILNYFDDVPLICGDSYKTDYIGAFGAQKQAIDEYIERTDYHFKCFEDTDGFFLIAKD